MGYRPNLGPEPRPNTFAGHCCSDIAVISPRASTTRNLVFISHQESEQAWQLRMNQHKFTDHDHAFHERGVSLHGVSDGLKPIRADQDL